MKSTIGITMGITVLLLGGCLVPDEDVVAYEGHNSHKTVTGEPIGSGDEANADLVKPITVTVLDAADGLEVGPGVVSRSNTSDASFIRVVVPVTNTGTRPACFVQAEDIVYDGPSGPFQEPVDIGFVEGSLGLLNSVQTTTCLAENETGYLLEIETLSFDDVDEIAFTLTIAADDPRDPLPRLEPSSYSTSVDPAVTVDFTNYGKGDAFVRESPDGFSQMVLLDDSESPLTWVFVNESVSPTDGIVAPDAMGQTSAGYLLFDGSASGVHVLLDFEDPSAESDVEHEPAPRSMDPVARATARTRARQAALRRLRAR